MKENLYLVQYFLTIPCLLLFLARNFLCSSLGYEESSSFHDVIRNDEMMKEENFPLPRLSFSTHESVTVIREEDDDTQEKRIK
jgi:hypothetical protein